MENIDVNSCWFPWADAAFPFYDDVSVWRLIQVRLATNVTHSFIFQLFWVNAVVL